MLITRDFFSSHQNLFLGASRTSSYVILEELLQRDYKVTMPYWPSHIIKFTDDKGRTRTINGVVSWETPALARLISGDKSITINVARQHGLPLLDSELYKSATQAKAFWLSHDGHCVLKTTSGAGGKGVWTKFDSEADFISKAAEHSIDSELLLQVKSFAMCDLRLLYVGDKLRAAAVRRPAFLVGDGTLSIVQLLEIDNKRRRQFNVAHHSTMALTILSIAKVLLRSGRKGSSVLPLGFKLQVSLANISDGGIAEDVTELLHSDFIKAGEQMRAALGCPVLAVDFLCDDPTLSFADNNEDVIFLETNTRPGIDLHHYPHKGKGRNIAGFYLDYVLNTCTA